ncbi:hypothetical protein [Pseudoduganella armeniaca]|uniref:hypothetical protein n=1 Tax=Pseudoduganella armeniaca TaxID=2072590 RepID=UPI0011B2A03B|nr:hypothetical protein [Pseudoduganella armeniaca]
MVDRDKVELRDRTVYVNGKSFGTVPEVCEIRYVVTKEGPRCRWTASRAPHRRRGNERGGRRHSLPFASSSRVRCKVDSNAVR